LIDKFGTQDAINSQVADYRLEASRMIALVWPLLWQCFAIRQEMWPISR